MLALIVPRGLRRVVDVVWEDVIRREGNCDNFSAQAGPIQAGRAAAFQLVPNEWGRNIAGLLRAGGVGQGGNQPQRWGGKLHNAEWKESVPGPLPMMTRRMQKGTDSLTVAVRLRERRAERERRAAREQRAGTRATSGTQTGSGTRAASENVTGNGLPHFAFGHPGSGDVVDGDLAQQQDHPEKSGADE
jgi:hypothetical protein